MLPDTFIQKTKKLYMDTRTQRNLNKLNEDLTEIHNIVTRNVQDVLGQGEKLDRASPLGQIETAPLARAACTPIRCVCSTIMVES